LIDVNGKPMIQRVVENMNYDNAHYIFLVRKSHIEKYGGLVDTLEQITNKKASIVNVESLTEGAACTALLAEDLYNSDEDLLIANSDQIIEYEPQNFHLLKDMTIVDGIVFTFEAVHPKWSFAKVDSKGFITEIAEKKPISNIATCGIYWFRKGKDFVKYAKNMINKNLRVNNEFYIAPVYNEMISEEKKLIPFYVHKMWGIGTPEDLKYYLENNK
jgi:dTDP-glucose pyrophosphorylase